VLISEPTYGSDEAGLICGYLFAPGRAGQPVGSKEAIEVLSDGDGAPGADGSFLWLHFNMTNAAADRWLEQHVPLPKAFRESLHAATPATRVEQAEGSLLAVLNDVLFEFDYDAAHVSSLSLCVQPRLIVTARIKPLRSSDRLREVVRGGEVFGSPVEMLAYLLHLQSEVLANIVRECTGRADRIEDNLLANVMRSTRSDLGRLRRLLVRLQRLLAPEPAALFRLLSRPPAWLREVDVQSLRESAEEFSTAVADCAALAERIKLLQEELAAYINEQTNRILFILTVVTVLALPFNVVGGLFGMNVGGIPFAEHDGGFWVVVVLVSVFTAAAAYTGWRWRRRRR
jgi:zinc transporter